MLDEDVLNRPTFVVYSVVDWNTGGARDAWFRMVEDDLSMCPVVGVDAEWVASKPTAVLQVASSRRCFIFHVSSLRQQLSSMVESMKMDGGDEASCLCSSFFSGDLALMATAARVPLPAEVQGLLKSDRVIKAGVNISGDAKRFLREWHISLRVVMELDHMAIMYDAASIGNRSLSLASLSESLLGIALGKELSITLSNWENVPLSRMQVEYAAADAIASALLGEHFVGRSGVKVDGPDCADLLKWVSDAEPIAKSKFKQAHRDFSRALQGFPATEDGSGAAPAARSEGRTKARLLSYHSGGANRSQALGDPYHIESLAARLSTSASVLSLQSVRVLSKEGHYIFSCDMRKALWYLNKKLAEVAERHMQDPAVQQQGTPKIKTIRLVFDPNVKTKLCLHFQMGACTFGVHCPYAHGSEELRSSSTTTTITSERASPSSTEVVAVRPRRDDVHCAICMSTSTSMKHAIVPPSLRRFLPRPFHCGVAQDFLVVCIQCNPRVRVAYDEALKSYYTLAERQGARVDMSCVKRVISYAQLLSRISSAETQTQEEFGSPFTGESPLSITEANASTRKKAKRNADAPRLKKKKVAKDVGDDTNEEGVLASASTPIDGGDACTAIPIHRKQEMREFICSNWKATHVELPPDLVSLSEGDPADVADDLRLLNELSKLSPGEVRAKATMRAIVGSDQKKAVEFIQEWRTFFEHTFHPAYVPWKDNGRAVTDDKSDVEPEQLVE